MCCGVMWVLYMLAVSCGGDIEIIFFFKQKTAYEVRISDWSSDVCSSDLGGLRAGQIITTGSCTGMLFADSKARVNALFPGLGSVEIGRASCRERVCQYV